MTRPSKRSELDRLSEQYAGLGHADGREFADAPPWGDEEAQLKYIRNRILAGWSLMFPHRLEEEREERAVEAALRGKPKKLADLIRQPNAQLVPSTRVLIAEFLSGERNLRTGRAKGEPGAPRQSEKLRRSHNRTHQAAEIFFVIRDTLPRIYPEKSQTDIRDRAMSLAAKLKGVDDPETIQNYLEKSKADRLPYRVFGYEEEDSPSGKWWSPDLL
jgi:hypothetical protein